MATFLTSKPADARAAGRGTPAIRLFVAAVHPHRHAHAGHLRRDWPCSRCCRTVLVSTSSSGVRTGASQVPGPEHEVRGDDVHPADAGSRPCPAETPSPTVAFAPGVDLRLRRRAPARFDRRGVRPGLHDHRRGGSERRGIIRVLALRAGSTRPPPHRSRAPRTRAARSLRARRSPSPCPVPPADLVVRVCFMCCFCCDWLASIWITAGGSGASIWAPALRAGSVARTLAPIMSP